MTNLSCDFFPSQDPTEQDFGTFSFPQAHCSAWTSISDMAFLSVCRSELFLELRRNDCSLSMALALRLNLLGSGPSFSLVTCGKRCSTLPNCYPAWRASFGICGSQLWCRRPILPAWRRWTSYPWWAAPSPRRARMTLTDCTAMAVAKYRLFMACWPWAALCFRLQLCFSLSF